MQLKNRVVVVFIGTAFLLVVTAAFADKSLTQKKIDKSKISMLVALTPNFEDEPYYSSKLVGIDFIIPEEPDRIVIVLSKNYIIRTVELKDFLSETQKEILTKWLKITDFSNKSQLHEILWQSFDLESVNKQFYKGFCL